MSSSNPPSNDPPAASMPVANAADNSGISRDIVPSLPVEILIKIVGYTPGGEAWQGQRQPNAQVMLSGNHKAAYMHSRKLIDPPLPWKPSRQDMQNARQKAARQLEALQAWGGAQPLDIALIRPNPEKPLDLTKPERRRILVFDDLRSMASWFTTGPGRAELVDRVRYPNLSFDSDPQRTSWQKDVQIIQVRFIDDARYSLENQVGWNRQPHPVMEYAPEAFAALANAMPRMRLQRLHIIVPGPRFTIFRSVDDPGFWELTHIRGLVAFDITGSIPASLRKHLQEICTNQEWQPTGMAYQPNWAPDSQQLTPGSTQAGTLNWPAIRASCRRTQTEKQHSAMSKRYHFLHSRHTFQRTNARNHKRNKLQALRSAIAELDAIQTHNNGPYTRDSHDKYDAETITLTARRDRDMQAYTHSSAVYTGMVAQVPAIPGPQRAAARRAVDRTQLSLIASQTTLLSHNKGGVEGFMKATQMSKKADYERALRKLRLARRQRRAAKRGVVDAAVLRDMQRECEGLGKMAMDGVLGEKEMGMAETRTKSAVDEAGDRWGRLLGDVSDDESDVNEVGVDRRML